jgi:hypothetical protein
MTPERGKALRSGVAEVEQRGQTKGVKWLRSALLAVFILALCACGSANHSHRRDYSVAQVVAAFKHHGIWLRMSDQGCSDGYVCLSDGGDNVFAYVFVGPKAGSLQYLTGGSDRQTDKGNLIVVWPRSDREQVGAAIQMLG